MKKVFMGLLAGILLITASKAQSIPDQAKGKAGVLNANTKVNADANQAKSVGKQTVESAKTATTTTTAKLKKGGTPDTRLKDNKVKLKLKNDGTSDMHFKANKEKAKAKVIATEKKVKSDVAPIVK